MPTKAISQTEYWEERIISAPTTDADDTQIMPAFPYQMKLQFENFCQIYISKISQKLFKVRIWHGIFQFLIPQPIIPWTGHKKIFLIRTRFIRKLEAQFAKEVKTWLENAQPQMRNKEKSEMWFLKFYNVIPQKRFLQSPNYLHSFGKQIWWGC